MARVLVLILLAAPALAADPAGGGDPVEEAVPSPRESWSPLQWLQEVDRRAQSVPGLRYSARRVTLRPSREGTETRFEERWRFALWGMERFRIDYFGDTARQVTSDGEILVDYVPANRLAMRHHLRRMEPADRAALVGQILEKVAVPGFRVGPPEGMDWSFGETTTWEGRPVVHVVGTGEGTDRLEFLVDRERLAVLRSEIHRDGQVVLRTDTMDHREIADDLWFPHEVRLRAPDPGGEVRVTLYLTRVAVLANSPDELFHVELDPSIPIEDRP